MFSLPFPQLFIDVKFITHKSGKTQVLRYTRVKCLIVIVNRVIVESNPQKFVSSLIETLHDKISQIQEEIKDCPTDELQQCEQWVMVLNEPLIEIEDEAGFIHVSNSFLKEKTEDMFCLLDSLQKYVRDYFITDKNM